MSEADSDDFLLMSNQERTAKIKATFSCLPPLATSSVKTNSSNNSSSLTPNSSVLSPDMSTTAIMRTFLPPNSCFETVFLGNSPVTRIVPQAETETLHISRSGSVRSLSHISSSYTRTAGTRTDTEQDKSQDSIKRMPKWRRYNRRKSSSDESRTSGKDNYGYTNSPPGISHGHSLDNLLHQETEQKNDFMLKYRQVSGDLRGSQELVEMDERPNNEAGNDVPRTRSRSMSYNSVKEKSARERSMIESKTVRKEKRKSRYRDGSGERSGTCLTPALRRVKLETDNYCYSNAGMDTSEEGAVKAPRAAQEGDLSPVPPPLSRQ